MNVVFRDWFPPNKYTCGAGILQLDVLRRKTWNYTMQNLDPQ